MVRRHLPQAVADFLKREDGPTAVEYAVMLAFIFLVCLGSVRAFGSTTNQTFNKVSSSINAAGS